jgi:acyl carrier protein
MQTSSATPEAVLATVARLIAEVVGDDLDLDEPIAMDTSFNADLELESIEMVALAEALQQEYGGRVDFVAWLSQKELDEIIELRVGQLVELIVACLSSSPTA